MPLAIINRHHRLLPPTPKVLYVKQNKTYEVDTKKYKISKIAGHVLHVIVIEMVVIAFTKLK
jgi:hypothetical protein